MGGTNVVGSTSGAGKVGVADPPQADANSMRVINDRKQKRTNLCWSMN
jgi:hypothetical protein